MSKIIPAVEAMEKAKKNALKIRSKINAGLMEKAQASIDKMIADGLVECMVSLNEDENFWGAGEVQAALVAAGYKVELEKRDSNNEDEIPDMIISIEHLK